MYFRLKFWFAAHLKRIVAVCAVVKVFRFDNIDDWHENTRRLLLYPLHQRFQPVDDALTVSVQEDEGVRLRQPSARQTRSNQAQPAMERRETSLIKCVNCSINNCWCLLFLFAKIMHLESRHLWFNWVAARCVAPIRRKPELRTERSKKKDFLLSDLVTIR